MTTSLQVNANMVAKTRIFRFQIHSGLFQTSGSVQGRIQAGGGQRIPDRGELREEEQGEGRFTLGA